MERLVERIAADPGNRWAWYELWKAIGLTEIPPAALEGLAEFGGKITRLPEKVAA